MYRTIQKAILYLFSTSLGELLAIVFAVFARLPLPLVPAQILWLNVITDPFMGAALALEPKERGIGEGMFQGPNRYFIDRTMVIRAVLMGAVMALGTLALFLTYDADDYLKASTMALTALAIFQWLNAWNCRSSTESAFRRPLENPWLVVATVGSIVLQLAVLEVPLLQEIFHTTSLSVSEWLWATGIALSVVLVEELRKIVIRLFAAAPRPVPALEVH